MATWGTYLVGFHTPMPEDQPVVAGKFYEARYISPIDIPDRLELPLIRELFKYREHGTEVTFVYCKRRTVIVQWYQITASPVSAGAIVAGLIAVAVIVIAVSLTLHYLASVGGLPEVLGMPATMIMSGIGLFVVIILLLIMMIRVVRR